MKEETKNEHGLEKFGHPAALRRRASTCFAFMLAKNIKVSGRSMRSNELLQSTARAKTDGYPSTSTCGSYNPNPK